MFPGVVGDPLVRVTIVLLSAERVCGLLVTASGRCIDVFRYEGQGVGQAG